MILPEWSGCSIVNDCLSKKILSMLSAIAREILDNVLLRDNEVGGKRRL
jgi:hypothetical protein